MDTVFTFLFKYAWFVFGFFNLAQAVFLPARADAIAKRSGDNSETVRAFLVGYAIYTTIPYFVLGGIQLLGGFESAFYIFFAPLNNPFVLTAILFMLGWWGLGAFFVFFRDGANTLRRYELVRGAGTGSDKGIKFIFALALLGGFLALIFGRFMIPQPPF